MASIPTARATDVKKRMSDCTGEELLEEALRHLRLDDAGHQEVKSESTCVPCMMPYITSRFMPRKAGDRPAVRPSGAENLAFVGQYAEAEKDVVFTVEYSVRTAKMAIKSLLESAGPDAPRIEVEPMYRRLSEFMGADAGRLDFTAPVLVADHIEQCASSEPTSGRLLADSSSEHCVIRGTPLNFRNQSTSCPIEADAGTGEFDPEETLS